VQIPVTVYQLRYTSYEIPVIEPKVVQSNLQLKEMVFFAHHGGALRKRQKWGADWLVISNLSIQAPLEEAMQSDWVKDTIN